MELGGASSETQSELEEWQQSSGDEEAGSEASGEDEELAVEPGEGTGDERVANPEVSAQTVDVKAEDHKGAGSEASGEDDERAVEPTESTAGESVEDPEPGIQAVHVEAGDEHGDTAQGGIRERT